VPPYIEELTPRAYFPGPPTLYTVRVKERALVPSDWVPSSITLPATPALAWATMETASASQLLPSIFAVKPEPPEEGPVPLLQAKRMKAVVASNRW
jgi:hypothetical protein